MDFKLTHILGDLRSSVVVFLVALPLCLGISLASGAPLLTGIIAGIIGGLVVGIFSNSKTSVSGPAAGLAIIVLGAIQDLGDFQTFTLAVLIAGLLQIGMGVFKIGIAGAYFPNSVIKGMLASIGFILILKQIPHAVGFDADFMGDEAFFQRDGRNTFSQILSATGAFQWGAVIIAAFCMGSMILWDKFAQKGIAFFQTIPSALFAVVAGVVFNEFIFPTGSSLKLDSTHLVSLPLAGGFGSFFDSFKLPNFDQLSNFAVYKVAITIAIVASIESLLSVEAVDKIDPRKNRTDKNRELLAQGIGNTVSGLVGALPITSVIVRSSANISAGARHKTSAILHGLWLFLAVSLIPGYLGKIPLAALAVILILVGFKLCHPKQIKQMAKVGKDQLIPFLVTFFAILFTDLLVGIFIGIITGFIFVLKSHSKKSIVVVNEGENYLVRFMKDVSFLQKPAMTQIFETIPEGASVVIDGSNHYYVDNDVVAIIEDFVESCPDKNIQCEIIKSSLAIHPYFRE